MYFCLTGKRKTDSSCVIFWKPNPGDCALERPLVRLYHLKYVIRDICVPAVAESPRQGQSHSPPTKTSQRRSWSFRLTKMTAKKYHPLSTCSIPDIAPTLVNIITCHTATPPPQKKTSVILRDEDIEAQRDKLPRAHQLVIMEPRSELQSLCSWGNRASVLPDVFDLHSVQPSSRAVPTMDCHYLLKISTAPPVS